MRHPWICGTIHLMWFKIARQEGNTRLNPKRHGSRQSCRKEQLEATGYVGCGNLAKQGEIEEKSTSETTARRMLYEGCGMCDDGNHGDPTSCGRRGDLYTDEHRGAGGTEHEASVGSRESGRRGQREGTNAFGHKHEKGPTMSHGERKGQTRAAPRR